MSNFNVQQTHPIIPREQTYVLFQKIISFHSYDRDICKWPNSNHFEIDLPQSLVNIQSMRLVQITLPNNQYVFTNAYQNTKLQFQVTMSALSPPTPAGAVGTFIIEISEGTYNAAQLVQEIENKMNKAVQTAGSDITGTWLGVAGGYNHFVCKYNEITNTFWFGNNRDSFTLLFAENPGYNPLPCGQPEVWNHYTKWGLPFYLGYEKKNYTSEQINDANGFGFDYESFNWLIPIAPATLTYTIKDPSCNMDIFGEEAIYMEVEKYNSLDELEPYSHNTMGLFNNDYAGKVNSAFAKIPINHAGAYAVYGDSTNFYLMNVSQFSPPIDRIMRLRFKFRYHDGRLVDFKCLPFNFSIEFNMLRDEPDRKMKVRVPAFYNYST